MGGAADVEFSEPGPEYPYIRVGLGWIGGIAIISGAGVGAWHLFRWLKYGVAEYYPASQLLTDWGLGYPHFSWVGVQRVIDWVLESPAGMVLFFGGFAFVWLCFTALEWHDESRRLWEQRKRDFERRRIEREREERMEAASDY